MGFENSPKIDEFSGGIPPKLIDQKSRRRWFWLLFSILSLLLIALLTVRLIQSGGVDLLKSTGSISGMIVDEGGEPVQAEIIVFNTDRYAVTESDGKFILDDVPTGNQVVVVGYQGAGFEFPVQVNAGVSTSMGQIQILTTAVP